MSDLVIPLDEVVDGALDTVGPKALNLARLARLDLPVPPGICVTAAAYRIHVETTLGHGFDAMIDRLAGEEEAQRRGPLLVELRAALESAPVSQSLEAELTAGWRELMEGTGEPSVAVRSSATAEDLPGHSFAGQHDSFLGVKDLPGCLSAIRRCWASAWTDRAYEYRARNGIDHRTVDMAVVVQVLVPVDVSGVIFTADPVSGRRDCVVIESCFGLGEALVSGRVTPDRVVLERPGLAIVERVTAHKELQIVPGGESGTEERALAERAGDVSLDDAMATRVAELALRAEEAFGVPLDLEFAVAGTPYLLQARPITALAGEETPEDRVVWSNLNTGEVLPDVVTPLTWSVVRPVIQSLFSGFFANMGMSVEGHTFFDLVGGRAYANLNTVMGAIRRIPGMRGRGITEIFGGQQGAAEALGEIEIADHDIPDLDFSVLRLLRRMPRFLWQVLTYRPAHGQRIVERLQARSSALLSDDLAPLPDRQLASRAAGTIHKMIDDTDLYEATGVGVLWEQVLFDNGTRWLGPGANPLLGACLAGLGNNDNANAGLALWRLAVLARREPGVEAAVQGAGGFAGLRERLAGEGHGGEFLAAWDAFMAEHGHHARGELELMNPRWSERPDEILDQVRSYLAALDDHDFERQYEGLVERREVAEREVRSRLHNPLKRWLLGFLLRKAQTCSPIRENLKNQLVRQLAGVRRVLLELGRRLADRGLLDRTDDLFFLALDEIEALVGGDEVRTRIAPRRAEYEHHLTLRLPPIVVGRFDPRRHAQEEVVDPDLRSLEGLGVNPGIATGPARVILRAGTDQLQPGEILVAPFTDPGWTPYFLNAAAIVMDQGGLLSHGSIVAREFGIPAVVNVGPATSIIETGQMVRVDGARGTVTILDEGRSSQDT